MTDEIKKMYEDFVHSIDENLDVTFFEGDGYFYDEDDLSINIDTTQPDEESFIYDIIKNHKCFYAKKIHIILWSILHEIGHYMTYEEESEEEEKIRFECMLNKRPIMDYYKLNNEFIATEWAVNWVEENLDTAINFSRPLEWT